MSRYLEYEETVFVEVPENSLRKDALAILELQKDEQQAILFLHPNVGTIDRLTALRLANSICRSGFQFEDNERLGTGFTLQIATDFESVFTKSKEHDSRFDTSSISEPKQKEEKEVDKVKVFESIAEFFWLELFGHVYGSWDDLPESAKKDLFSLINVEYLSNEQVQELFTLRHHNNKEGFMKKLAEFSN